MAACTWPSFPSTTSTASRRRRRKLRGSIKLLEDTEGDGVYDKVTVFADNIDSPVALACWDGGVFVGSVPDILYLKDTDGDGKADVRKVVYTGFGRDKAGEAMLNSFRWGLDNRFHVSTSAAGGNVKRAELKDAQVFNVRGQGFLFDPRTLKFELVAGSGQHGMSMDDWGRKFTCDNSNPCHLLMYDGRYLLRQSVRAGPAAHAQHPRRPTRRRICNASAPMSRGAWSAPGCGCKASCRARPKRASRPAISPAPPASPSTAAMRFRPRIAARCSSAKWPTISSITPGSRPTASACHAQRVEKDAEFLASTDTWFRPAQFANAPDGTLYVIDMYRELIETTESIPPLILKHLHPESGIDRGPNLSHRAGEFQTAAPAAPEQGHDGRAGQAAGARQRLASRHRRRDCSISGRMPSAIPLLQKLARQSPSPLGPAACSLRSGRAQRSSVQARLPALEDEEPRVREHALRLAERFQDDVAVRDRLQEMTADPDLRVRYQLAFSLGRVEGDKAAQALHRLAKSDGSDPWFRLGILTSAHGRRGDVFRLLAGDDKLRQSAEGKILLTPWPCRSGRPTRPTRSPIS